MLVNIKNKLKQAFCHQMTMYGGWRILLSRLLASLLFVFGFYCLFTSAFTVLCCEVNIFIYFHLLTGTVGGWLVMGSMITMALYLMCAKTPNQFLCRLLKVLEKKICNIISYVFRLPAMPAALKLSDLVQFYSSYILPAPYTPPRYIPS